MANIDNIRDKGFNTRTTEEQREIARQGGIRSGEVRREKAMMKKTLEMLLEEKNNKGKTYKELSTLGLIKGAIDGKAENYKLMLQILGELNTVDENTEARITIVNTLPSGDKDESNN